MRKLLIASLILLALILSLSPGLVQKTQAAPNAYLTTKPMPVTIRMYYDARQYCVTTDGLQVYTWYCQSDSSGQPLTSQQWQLIPRSTTTQASIRLANTSKCVSANPTTGALTMASCNYSAAAQCWDVYDTAVGLPPEQPINPCNNAGKSLQPVPNVFGYPNGVPIKVYPNVSPRLTWYIGLVGGSPIRIRSLWSNKCVTMQDANNVVQSDCGNNERQFFKFDQGVLSPIMMMPAGSHVYSDYLCNDYYAQNGSRPFACTQNRSFRFRAVGGYFQVWPGSPVGLCLDINNTYPATQNGAPIQLWQCLGANQSNQLWSLEKLVEIIT